MKLPLPIVRPYELSSVHHQFHAHCLPACRRSMFCVIHWCIDPLFIVLVTLRVLLHLKSIPTVNGIDSPGCLVESHSKELGAFC